jgi:hypothetical protein
METTTIPPEIDHSPASQWEDFVDIFYAPREVFARRSEGGRWGLPLLLITLLMLVLYYASQSVLGPLMEAEFARAMEANPSVSAEQMEQMREMAGTFGLLGFAVGYPFSIIFAGLVLWAIGKLFDSVATVGGALLIATYAQFPRLPQQGLSLIQGLVMDVGSMESIYAVSFSPARFLDPDVVSAAMLGVAGRFDLFVLWSTVLLAIGLNVVGRVPKAQAYFAAALVWGLGAVPVLVGSLAGGG